MNHKILFLSDSPPSNPILHSQGLPLLNYVSRLNYKVWFLWIKHYYTVQNENEIEKIKSKFGSKINFIQVEIPKTKFFPAFLYYFFIGYKSVYSIMISEKISLIHTRSLLPGIVGLLVKIFSLSRISFLYDNRGLYIEENIYLQKWRRNSLKVRILVWLENFILNKSDQIVVVSNKFKEFLCKNKKLKNKNKINIISNNVQIQLSNNKRTFRKNKITFVYTGSAAKWYSSQKFVELFIKLNSNFRNARFLILTYETEIFRDIIMQHQDLLDKTEIQCVSSDKVHEQLLNCDVGILLREENIITSVSSPLKFAEYLNAGLPVIVNPSVGDTEEIIAKYKVGVILKKNEDKKTFDELNHLLADPQLAIRCREVVKKEFDQQAAFQKYIKVYEKLLNNE